MPALNPSTDKLVTSSTGNLKDALPLDMRDFEARVLKDMGLAEIEIGNTAPSDRSKLWYHRDVRTLKRFDPTQGNWFGLTSNQAALHLINRVVKGAATDISLETGDLFVFWDVSLQEAKVITRDSLMAALGAVRSVTTSEGIQGGGTLGANRELKLDINGLTAKPAPKSADLVAIYSAADGAHRKATVDQIAASITLSDYLHSEMFFLGSM
ncbi:hypothetical protein [Antarcticirhabdus aurantiaca]|uniref:Uncharacterized protein n=1 Tax=Antarcticirhabdus aurantiaca TaxID=2606717 RepID=A0ACD4NJZ3_9HYPH|nr:hypothetical protein [Antarcticirhabdus aurantiaca]WAJ27142.1 hypothetical protein OXU80_20130 [Jeongeuplla avenae]